MKITYSLIGIAACALFFSFSVSGQCVPDPGCVDVNEPGEICPRNLPNGKLNVPYNEVITIIPPATTVYNESTIQIAYITVDSVNNLPPGITYTTYNEKYYPDSAYCIDVTGTPTETGEFNLAIYVSVFITIIQSPAKVGQIVDDSSVVMKVTEAGTGIIPSKGTEFKMLNASPNPFFETTRIGYYLPYDNEVELKVYNILGEQIYHELMFGIHGENYFDFNGSNLNKGAYFYGITYKSKWHTGKFIKME